MLDLLLDNAIFANDPGNYKSITDAKGSMLPPSGAQWAMIGLSLNSS
jgi:hypothetical protein